MYGIVQYIFKFVELDVNLVLGDDLASLNVAAAFSAAEASALAKPGDHLVAASLHFRQPHPDGMCAGIVTHTSTLRAVWRRLGLPPPAWAATPVLVFTSRPNPPKILVACQ